MPSRGRELKHNWLVYSKLAQNGAICAQRTAAGSPGLRAGVSDRDRLRAAPGPSPDSGAAREGAGAFTLGAAAELFAPRYRERGKRGCCSASQEKAVAGLHRGLPGGPSVGAALGHVWRLLT